MTRARILSTTRVAVGALGALALAIGAILVAVAVGFVSGLRSPDVPGPELGDLPAVVAGQAVANPTRDDAQTALLVAATGLGSAAAGGLIVTAAVTAGRAPVAA